MKNLRAFVLCFFAIVLAGLAAEGCKKEPPVVPEPTLALTAVDASCTEAWLKATTTQTPATVRLVRLTPTLQTLQTLQLTTTDTLLIDEGLLPKRTYTYQLQRLAPDSSVIETSPSTGGMQVTTMDTTSHNFTWRIDTLGDGNSSVLHDVAIINDTLAYAVGAIYKRDSLGNWDPNAHNMVKWDGNTWELMSIQFYTICGQTSRTPYPAKTIFAFSETDIWIAMDGDQVARWNGTTQTTTMCLPVSFAITKLWGENSNSMYTVGEGGNIMHYASGTWRRLESGTTLRIQDIWGIDEVVSGRRRVLAVASNKFTNDGVAILEVTSGSVTMLSVSGLPTTSLVNIWSPNGRKYYVCGDGLYTTYDLRSSWRKLVNGVPPIYQDALRGNGLNDIIVTGAFGLVLHWNGMSWHEYSGSELPYFLGQYQAVNIKDNTVMAVGWLNSGKATVLTGRR